MATKNNYNKNNNQMVKRSGFGVKTVSDGVKVCYGWKSSPIGVISIYAKPYGKTSLHKGQKGDFLNYMVVITNKTTGTRQISSGLFYFNENRLIIPAFSWIGTTNGSGMTSNGKKVTGYFGKLTR